MPEFYVTVVSAATSSATPVDLGQTWGSAYLVIPSMTSNSQIYIRSSDALAGTYRRVKHPSLNSSTVTTNDYAIHSSCTNTIVPIPDGLRYVKVEMVDAPVTSVSFSIICGAY